MPAILDVIGNVGDDKLNIDYIIVQAGGKGTRFEHLTKNKPKALVPVSNLPMIFHLFKQFPKHNFIVISDYKSHVLRKYLATFATVNWKMVESYSDIGTCAGLQSALALIPEYTPFMFVWCDLILSPSFVLPEINGSYIGISKDFECRWSYKNYYFVEEKSKEHGIAGLFVFPEKSVIKNVDASGEFVRWLSNKNISFTELPLYGTKEFGTLEEYSKLKLSKCRPFNQLTVNESEVVKEPLDEHGRNLAELECGWYKFILEKNFAHIPQITNFSPLVMERIKGLNLYEMQSSLPEKRKILSKLISVLRQLHSLDDGIPTDKASLYETYVEKTFTRLEKVRGLIPFTDKKYIEINGRKCKNVFFFQEQFTKILRNIDCNRFYLIHGDCTFSNIMLRDNSELVLIDPRGYFGGTKFYGHALYDWAKVYYSIIGNYDQFNLKNFRLDIGENSQSVELTIKSNGWEDLESYFFNELQDEINIRDLKLVHALIWLSLTTYAWEDFDSISGAFYNGLYYLEVGMADEWNR